MNSNNEYSPIAILVKIMAGWLTMIQINNHLHVYVVKINNAFLTSRNNQEFFRAHVVYGWHMLKIIHVNTVIKNTIAVHQVFSSMMTSPNGNLFRVTGPLSVNSPLNGEFPSQRPVTSFDVFCDLRLNKLLSKQSKRRRFETTSRSLWRHCNVDVMIWKRFSITGPWWGEWTGQ